MAFPLALIPAIISSLTGTYQAISGGKLGSQRKELLDLLKSRAKYGLTGQERAEWLRANVPIVSRGLSAKRNQLASAIASRGASDSSFATRTMASIPTAQEALMPELVGLDTQIRSNALSTYSSMLSDITAQREQAISSGLGLVGSSMGELMNIIDPQEQMSLEDIIELIFRDRIVPD